jgi:hypothetical protein
MVAAEDGGSASAIRCRHLHQRATLRPLSKRLPMITLLLALLLFAASCRPVSAAEEPNNSEVTEQRPLLLYIPMHVSEPLENLQELCDRTLSKDPWVAKSGREQKDEKGQIIPLAFDILLVVSGPSEASHNATKRFAVMRSMLEAATENMLPSSPRIFTDFKSVGVDRYNLNLAEEDKDSEWVSGPNSVFYDAFVEGGEIYEKYTRFYELVQQLETDVCALRGGWLLELLRPMLVLSDDDNDISGGEVKSESESEPEALSESSLTSSSSSSLSSPVSLSSPSSPPSSPSSSPSSSSIPSPTPDPAIIIISGSTIQSHCMYVVKYDECQPFDSEAPHMTEHVNGNAVYRMGETLQLVLKSAREQFGNAEPFDLAIYHVLKASNASSTLAYSNPLYHNTATLLDRDWFLDFRYHGVDDLAVLHAPRRLRADGLKTVATRAQGYLPATTVVLSEEESMDGKSGGPKNGSATSNKNMLLRNFKAAADELQLSGVIYIALSEEVFFRASLVVPLQVLPAFEKRNDDGDDDLLRSRAGSGAATAAATSAAASASAAATATSTSAASESASAAATAAASSAAATLDPKTSVLTWPPTSPSPASRLLATITQLVTQGYSPLVVDAASVPLQSYDMVLYGFPKDAVFFTDTSPSVGHEMRRPFGMKRTRTSRSSTIIETMYAPASAYTANFLQAWAVKTLERQQRDETDATSALLTIADLKSLAACRFDTMSGFSPCPWRGISVETLPLHWFPPQVAFFGSGWTRRARKHALFLDMSSSGNGGGDGGGGGDGVALSTSSPSSSSSSSSSPTTSKTIFRLRQAGKWHTPARCPTFAVLARLPRDLTHETVFDEVAFHAEFLSFVRERKIACAVLPGFRILATGATVPVDAFLDLENLQASAGKQATLLPRVQDVEEASKGFVAFVRRQDRQRSKQIRSSSSHYHLRKQKDPEDLCSAFGHFAPSSTSADACVAREISLALNEARVALPLSSFVCAVDTPRTVDEVALVGLRGASGLARVAAEVSKVVADAASKSSSAPSRSPADATTTPILLTGAWRLLPRGSFGNAAAAVSSSSSALPSSSSRTVMTLSDLHSHDQRMQCAQELNPKTSPLVDEAWADVLEALLCRRAVFSIDVSQLQLSTSLAVPESENKTNPRSKGYRKSTTTTSTITKTKTFAELVARHIPSSILLEDVAAFTRWLARPDRPKIVRGRSLQFVFAGVGEDKIAAGKKGKDISPATTTSSSSPPSSSRHRAALLSLSLLAPTIAETRAEYAFLPAAADATTARLLPWSSVTEIGELYRARPALLPSSLAVMMHSSAVIGFLHSPESSTLPLLNVAMDKKEATSAGVWKDGENEHLFLDVAFRKTVTALGRMKRRENALLKPRKKLWALPPSAAAAAATAVMGNQHRQSKGASLPVSSMGASDDVVFMLGPV